MIRVVFCIICLFAFQRLYSQEIRGVEGRWQLTNITREEAREKAIEEAKKEALRRAGVEERIRATETVSTFEANDLFQQMYNAFSSVEMSGAVISFEVVRDDLERSKIDGQWYATVTINATVKKYTTTTDPEFKIDVRGLRSNGYRNGEVITFSVIPNKNGFMKIFVFENSRDATLLFPNDFEKNRKLKAKETINFPTVHGIEYYALKTTADRLEHNLWVFVYTKSDIPYYGAVTYHHVISWINNIEPSERDVIIEPLLITE